MKVKRRKGHLIKKLVIHRLKDCLLLPYPEIEYFELFSLFGLMLLSFDVSVLGQSEFGRIILFNVFKSALNILRSFCYFIICLIHFLFGFLKFQGLSYIINGSS